MIGCVLLVVACAAVTTPLGAQTIQPNPPPGTDFLTRFAFHVSLEHLFSDEKRFVWDANFAGELDLVDYGVGRATFLAHYETILGSEFRAFDPNQGNYVLDGSVSARLVAVEIAAVFHHVSRHLSDRPKRHPIDWNMIGGRIRRSWTRDGLELEGRADLRSIIQKSFVDYRWEMDADVRARVGLSPRVAAVAGTDVRVRGVDHTRGRDTQYGVRGEGGVRLEGRNAALELFVAAERRIDPYQLEFSTATWLTTGFRLSSR